MPCVFLLLGVVAEIMPELAGAEDYGGGGDKRATLVAETAAAAAAES